MIIKEITIKSIGISIALVVQKKSTPFKKPKNKDNVQGVAHNPPKNKTHIV